MKVSRRLTADGVDLSLLRKGGLGVSISMSLSVGCIVAVPSPDSRWGVAVLPARFQRILSASESLLISSFQSSHCEQRTFTRSPRRLREVFLSCPVYAKNSSKVKSGWYPVRPSWPQPFASEV